MRGDGVGVGDIGDVQGGAGGAGLRRAVVTAGSAAATPGGEAKGRNLKLYTPKFWCRVVINTESACISVTTLRN